MKQFRCLIFLALAAGLLAAGCGKEKPTEQTGTPSGVYILNNGDMKTNDSNIGRYDPATGRFYPDVFMQANGAGLGNLGQDMLIDGDKVYIAVNGSQIIFVTDKSLKIKDKIIARSQGEKPARLSPRYMTKAGDKIYVTYYEGFIGEINPENLSVRLLPTGPNPEKVVSCKGKLYVANSGGMNSPTYDNTISVVDPASFTEVSRITVNPNPVSLAACGNYVYVLSYGNYSDIPSRLQALDVETGKVQDVDYQSVSAMALSGEKLYVLCGGYDAAWNPLPGTVHVHNAADNTKMGAFVADATVLPKAYSISATANHVWVGCSDYKTNGDMYVFTKDGKLADKFDTGGLNPIGVFAD